MIKFNGPVYCPNDYVCWSAPEDDLSDWRYEGVIYPKTNDPFNKDGHMCLYAPDVTLGPDGRYYLFYVLDMALFTVTIDPDALPLPEHIIHKHWERKHGKNAYYGQK